MTEPDVPTVAQLAVRVGLITDAHVREAYEELGARKNDLHAFLRCLERQNLLTPLQSSKLLKGDPDGYFLGGYRLLYKIASGSFGRVYRADDPRSGRVVAVKVLRRRWSEDKQRIDLFMREGKVGMGLHHPNIVEIVAVNKDPTTNQYYLVMEFVEGGNLREMLATWTKLQPKQALKLLEDMAAGLAYAYSRGLTHRDIKLTNILIASTGEAKLVDFGLAKIFGGAPGADEERVERTVDYAGLEKATNVKSGDVRSDIYFLGCVAYHMLVGRSPIQWGRDKYSRMARGRFLDVQPMSHDEVDAPSSVFHLVETMMALEPQARYQTPAQLLEAVKTVRKELEGGKVKQERQATVFLIESDARLQDAIRDKLKGLGYRVYLAMDPARALDRYRQQPYDALIVDVGTTGEEGLLTFDRIMMDASRQGHPCQGIAILSEEQAGWRNRVSMRPHVCLLVRPVTLKQLHTKLAEMLADADGS